MAQIIAKALTLASPGSLAEGRLLAHYGWELGRVEGDYAAAQGAFNRALAIAQDAGDAGLELSTLTRSADVDLFHLRLGESSTKSLECIELAVRAGDTYEEAIARLTATRTLIIRGEGAEAQTQASTLLALGERVGNRYWLGMGTALHQNSDLACLRGDWSKGRDLAKDAQALASQDPITSSILAMLEYETGNFSEGEAYLERLLEIMALAPPPPTGCLLLSHNGNSLCGPR